MASLYYYKAQGKAQQIRFALAVAGVQFQDVYPQAFPPTKEEKELWQSIGGNTTTNVPMLVTADKKVYTQSLAIMTAVGRMAGLMPQDQYEQYQVDNLMAAGEDFRSLSYKAITMFGATPETQANYVNNFVPQHLGNFERLLGSNDYFVGNKMSIADLSLFDAIVCFGQNQVPNCLANFPGLQKWVKRVSEIPSLKAYMESEECNSLMKFPAIVL